MIELARIKHRMGENLSREPDYTCVETIERSQRHAPTRKFDLLDAVRLEVALVGGKEMYAWPGAGKFEETDMRKFVPEGAIGNGYFALHARSVFLTEYPMFTYRGPETLEGHNAVRYDFRLPLLFSSYHLRVGNREALVGYHGSFWAETGTLDVLRLVVDADDIPLALGMKEADVTIDYARLPIGSSDFLLPVSSDLLMIDLTGSESRNRMRFTSCRQYSGESVLSFGDPPPAAVGPDASRPVREIRLAAGLRVDIELAGKIDSRETAVGDPVRGTVKRDVKQGGEIVIPKGATLFGRLTRLEHRTGMFAASIVFATVEWDGGRGEFHAELKEVDGGSSADPLTVGSRSERWGLAGRRGGAQMTAVQPSRESGPPPGSFYVMGDRVQLPRGFHMVWRTLPPDDAARSAPGGPQEKP